MTETQIISDGNAVFVQPPPQGRSRDATFVPDWEGEGYGYGKKTGTYLIEFDYGVVGEYSSWHGRIPAEQLVGLSDWDVSQSISHAEFPPRWAPHCHCSACRGRVKEQF